jgi:hypothetical protein
MAANWCVWTGLLAQDRQRYCQCCCEMKGEEGGGGQE